MWNEPSTCCWTWRHAGDGASISKLWLEQITPLQGLITGIKGCCGGASETFLNRILLKDKNVHQSKGQTHSGIQSELRWTYRQQQEVKLGLVSYVMPHTGRPRLLHNPDKQPPSTTSRGKEGGDRAPKRRLIPRDTSGYINSRYTLKVWRLLSPGALMVLAPDAPLTLIISVPKADNED